MDRRILGEMGEAGEEWMKWAQGQMSELSLAMVVTILLCGKRIGHHLVVVSFV